MVGAALCCWRDDEARPMSERFSCGLTRWNALGNLGFRFFRIVDGLIVGGKQNPSRPVHFENQEELIFSTRSCRQDDVCHSLRRWT
ncbi:unnamed protein product [Protopolystoma xenopodis]|uniref:Uncharacterized protein n=1 Tax=Protopolystoma xenopodis TaxID=117903 RepID=A0A448XC10_9PLAT|nr:unnamed protein product [Protopolystoma xenopodis]